MEAPLALYRRYRPETFAEVIGQEHVTAPLRNALSNNRVNHAYLFSGPRGCGKTTSARILARAINCEKGPIAEPCGVCKSCTDLARGGPGSIDVIEIDAASHGGVDDARDLRERAFFAPVESRYKIYIIDEAHMVTTQGFNALLKLVEEPPPHLKFIFATTEPDKVIGTIRSRTHHYPFRLVPPKVLADYMATLCTAEGVAIEAAALPLVVRAGAGSVRDSLSVLDQLIGGAGPAGVTYELAVALLGFTPDSLLDACVDGFAAHDSAAVFETIEKVIETGQDPKRFAEDLLRRLRDLVVLSAVPTAVTSGLIEAAEDQGERLQTQAAGIGPAELTRAADIVAAGLLEMRGATAPRLQLELICAKVLLPGADDSTNGIQARLDRMERRLAIGVPAGTPDSAPAPVSTTGHAQPPAPTAGHTPAAGPVPTAGHAAAAGPAAGPAADSATSRAAARAAASGTRADDPTATPPANPAATPPAPPTQGDAPAAGHGQADGGQITGLADGQAAGLAIGEPSAGASGASEGAVAAASAGATQDAPGGSSASGAVATGSPNAGGPASSASSPTSNASGPGSTAGGPASSAGGHASNAGGPGSSAGGPGSSGGGVAASGVSGDGARTGAWGDESAVSSAPTAQPTHAQPAEPQSTQAQSTQAQSAQAQSAQGSRGAQDGRSDQSGQGAGTPGGGVSAGVGAGSGGVVGLADVRRLWPEVLDAVKAKRRFAWIMLSQNAQVIAIDDQTLTLGLVNAGARESFARSGSDEILRQAMIDTIGINRRVEAVVDPSTDPGAGGGSAPRPSPQPGSPQAGGPQAGGSQAGGSQAGGSQAGGLQAGGPPSGGVQPGGAQPGGAQAGGLQAGGPPSGGVQPGGAQAGGLQSGGSQSGGLQGGQGQAGGPQGGGLGAGQGGPATDGGSAAGGHGVAGSDPGGSGVGGAGGSASGTDGWSGGDQAGGTAGGASPDGVVGVTGAGGATGAVGAGAVGAGSGGAGFGGPGSGGPGSGGPAAGAGAGGGGRPWPEGPGAAAVALQEPPDSEYDDVPPGVDPWESAGGSEPVRRQPSRDLGGPQVGQQAGTQAGQQQAAASAGQQAGQQEAGQQGGDRRRQAASKRRAAEAAVAAEQARAAAAQAAAVPDVPLTPEEEADAIGEDDQVLEEDSRSHTDLLRETLGAQIITEEPN